jgi:hypothetical protein
MPGPAWLVRNTSTGHTIGDQIEYARSYWARFRGLMLRGPLAAGGGMVIDPCSSIQMTFMRYPIDAVFFDKDGHVTRVAKRVRPWIGFAAGGRGAKGVLELPVGAADGIEPGHSLEFVELTPAKSA